VASAETLLAEAEFASRNITPGSTDEKRYTALAKRYASKLVRKYPASQEADQARDILRHLGIGVAAKPVSRPRRSLNPSPHVDHTPEAPHRHELRTPVPKAVAPLVVESKPRRNNRSRDPLDDSWQNIWRIFAALSYTKKKIIAFVLMLAVVFIGFTPFLLLFFLYYAAQPAKIRSHVHQFVTYFA
jgi:hypothetical protein